MPIRNGADAMVAGYFKDARYRRNKAWWDPKKLEDGREARKILVSQQCRIEYRPSAHALHVDSTSQLATRKLCGNHETDSVQTISQSSR